MIVFESEMAAWSKRLGTVLIGGYLVGGCFAAPKCTPVDFDRFPRPDAPEIAFIDAYGTCPNDNADSCSPTAQTGCNASEKCTWILGPEGHCDYIGCAPNGTIEIGDACGSPETWAQKWDSCVKGAACVDGECRQVCDNNGGTPMCDAMHACQVHDDLFTNSGSSVAGVCDPGCDPLTQELLFGTDTAACGSVTPDAPEKGCYGYGTFACIDVPAEVGVTHTDRTVPVTTNFEGTNSCSPGFIPFFYESTGSTRTLCTGLCSALEIDNTPQHVGNTKGNPSALGKLPSNAAAELGDATCDVSKKGSDASSVCKFIWPYLVYDDGTLPPGFEHGPYLDSLGVCFARDHYFYDANGDMVPETPYPDCSTLPPHSDATPGKFDDAADFGCQTKAHTPPGLLTRAPMARVDTRVSTNAPALARHDLR
ncbi:MAG TPA: hypothetical protein VGM90_21395 [Kofleriaceae bacterium]|jgi:hypothetical protein